MEFSHFRWALSTTRIGRRGCAWWFVVFNVIAIVATNSLPYPVQPFSHFILFLLIALYLDQIIQSSPDRPPSLGQKGDPPSRRAWHPILRWWELDWFKLLDVAKSLSFWLEPMPKAQTFGCRQCQDLKCLAVTIAKSFDIILRLWHSSISWGPSRRHWGAVQVANQFKGFSSSSVF